MMKMAKLSSPVLSGIAATAIAMAAWTTIQQTQVVSAFQTPVIFPLLWMAKRLTQHNRIGSMPPFTLMMPPLSSIKSLVAMNNKDGQQKNENNDDSTERLIEWLDEMDGTTSNVKVDANSQGLRGLYATKDIKSKGIAVEIPFDAALMVGDTLWGTIFDDFDDVPGSDDWSEEDLDDVYQGLNLLQSFMEDEDYHDYVRYLPEKPTSGDEAGTTPDFWSEEFIVGLEVPSYVEQILERKQIVHQVAKKNNVDENDLRWATWMIRSRRITTWNMVDDPESDDGWGAFPMRNKQVEQVQGFLMPLIDMANHSFEPNAALKISVNRWTGKFDESSTFALRALRPIKKGEEVTIMYGDGDRTSLDLLDKYGFFLDKGNEADEIIDWEELNPEFTTSLEDDEGELAIMLEQGNSQSKKQVMSKRGKLKTIVSKIQEYEPNFSSEVDGLQFVGSGLRQKMGIKIYAVAMYGTPELLLESSSSDELRNAARSFSDTTFPRTTFVLEIILQGDADTIADAIANSVKLRYDGPPADVLYLESLIAEGLRERGGKKTKGSILQFDCTEDGVSVSIDGVVAGTAEFKGLGGAFVDVFMDENTVSPSLVNDCLKGGNAVEEGGGDDSATSAATMEEQNGTASKRTMLSLRVLMKRLSNWQMKNTALPIADEAVVDGGNLEQQEELLDSKAANDQDGSDTLDISLDVSDETDTGTSLVSSSSDEIDIVPSADEGELELIELTNEDESELSELADETAEEVTALNKESTPEPTPMNEAEIETEATPPPPPPSSVVATENSSTFDVDAVQAKIRALEAEIQAEIDSLKAQDVPLVELPSGTPATAISVDPAPDSSNEIAGQVTAEDSQVALEEEAKLKMEEEEEKQKAAKEAAEKAAAEARQKSYEAVESKMKPLKDRATGVEFNPKLDDGLYLVGVGVRKKAIINVYAVAMYSSPSVLEALSPFPRGKQKQEAQITLRNSARTFDESSRMTSFVLEMVFKADAQTIAGAIADGVKPCYSGPAADVNQLEALIIDGVKSKGGQATKGTIFRFDCTAEGVEVSVDGNDQGMANFEGMGSAFVDVFMGEKAVSPQLVSSCLETWCGSGIH